MLVAIDIETRARPEFAHLENAALIPHMAEISVIGVYTDRHRVYKTFRGKDAGGELVAWLNAWEFEITGHNFKFDIKHLVEAGVDAEFLLSRWKYDSHLLAHIYTSKPSDGYLAQYEEARLVQNKLLPHGTSHRNGGPLSLKVLAPLHLDVQPFWENPADHDSDEYVLKDCEYTLRLTKVLLEKMSPEEREFFTHRQLPWTKNLVRAELSGVYLDSEELLSLEADLTSKARRLEDQIKEVWEGGFNAYIEKQKLELVARYDRMRDAYLEGHQGADRERVAGRYEKLMLAACESLKPLNLASPQQLAWLLRDHYGYNIRSFDGEESTDKEVLQRLAQEGKADVKLLLDYRETSKVLTAFIPTYKELQKPGTGTIHPNFNPAGTKTGRLSCSSPNLQQCPAEIRQLFKPRRKQNKFITKDYSMLEPVLIGYFTQDPLLKSIIKEGKSFHSVNAQLLFNLPCSEAEVKKLFPAERDAAKEAGLSILYGAGANRLMQSLQKRGFQLSKDQCQQMVYLLRDSYKEVWEFKQELDRALEFGETIYNYMGRPIRFQNADDVYMKGFNRLIQGSGSDILQQAAFDIANASEGTVRPLLFVHDELVCEVQEGEAKNAERLIDYHMTKFDLGDLKLSTEGGIASEWHK